MTDARTHELKTWPEFFRAIRDGRKRFELRRNDRDFGVGDCLVLREWNPETKQYTGHKETRYVTYVLEDAEGLGLVPGFVIMGLGQ
jgi:hypothetical protein